MYEKMDKSKLALKVAMQKTITKILMNHLISGLLVGQKALPDYTLIVKISKKQWSWYFYLNED